MSKLNPKAREFIPLKESKLNPNASEFIPRINIPKAPVNTPVLTYSRSWPSTPKNKNKDVKSFNFNKDKELVNFYLFGDDV